MKRITFCLTFVFTALFVLSSCSNKTEMKSSFDVQPPFPKQGDEITVRYNPDSTNLAGKSEIQFVAYYYNDELIDAKDIPLQKDGNILIGKIKTDENTFGVLLKFKSEDKIDNNKKKGYVIYIYDDKGNTVPGALAGFAAAINRWGAYYTDIDRDKERAFSLFEEDFKKNPKIKYEFLNSYFETVTAVKPELKNEIIQNELSDLEKKEEFNEKELTTLTKWYGELGDTDKAGKYKNEIIGRFPKSDFVQNLKYKEFRNANNVDKMIQLAKEFEKQFPESESVSTMYDLIANRYRDNHQFNKALNFLGNKNNKSSTYRYYSVVNRMLDEKADLNTALKIAKLGIERSRNELNNPTEVKPKFLSESEWMDEREYYLGLNLYGEGKVYDKVENKQAALDALTDAVKYTKEKDETINEMYAKALIESSKYHLAMNKIVSFIKSGYSTPQMKSLLKEAFLNEKGTEQGFNSYVEKIEESARENLISKLKSKMIVETAYDFTLKDIDGRDVSLHDYKGKRVVLDFWATWCGPCKASFPGMKKLVQKYQDDNSIVFLFVNTWERVKDKTKNAADFIRKNEYPFHVLMDEENSVIEKYKVSGIPTKFIIDGNGNIRFKSVGFSGSDDKLVEEVSLMLSMAK